MLDTTAKAVQFLFNSPDCALLPKTDNLYTPADVLAVWSLQSGFFIRLKADGYMWYTTCRGENAFEQTIHCVREVEDLINYFN